MDSSKDHSFQEDASGARNTNSIRCLLRQRQLHLEACCSGYKVLGQCYVAVLLCLVVILNMIKYENIKSNIFRSIFDDHVFDPAISKWSASGLETAFYGSATIHIFFQVPGALLIYIISGHKFLTTTVAISSLFHMLTPLAGYSGIFEIMLLTQAVMEAPVYIAVLSIWKDWAPPGQRTIFVYISLCGWILNAVIGNDVYAYLETFHHSIESFYITGACGLGWSLLWFLTVPATFSQDPPTPEIDQLSQRNNTHYNMKWWSKIPKIPWKRIITSMPVLVLCLISFKIGSFLIIFILMNFRLTKIVTPNDEQYSLLPFSIVYIVVLTGSAVITDILSRKFPRQIKIRKRLVCSALIIHAAMLFGILIPNIKVQTYCFWISYIMFSTTLPGFISNALELSSKYVAIVFGFAQTFNFLGWYLSTYYLERIFLYYAKRKETNFFGGLLYYEIGFTIVAAISFKIWGSFEERPWSLSIPLRHPSAIDQGDVVEESEI